MASSIPLPIIAIWQKSLGLSLVAFDNADNLLCVRLQIGRVRLLSLRGQRHGQYDQNPHDQSPVHKFHQEIFTSSVLCATKRWTIRYPLGWFTDHRVYRLN